MADEFKNPAQGGCSTMQLFLKYSPDSVMRLFDRCLTKPCMGQVSSYFLVHTGWGWWSVANLPCVD